MDFVIYGENGEYVRGHYTATMKSMGSDRALTRLAKAYSKRWQERFSDGLHPALIGIFKGTLSEFYEAYPRETKKHSITGDYLLLDKDGNELLLDYELNRLKSDDEFIKLNF